MGGDAWGTAESAEELFAEGRVIDSGMTPVELAQYVQKRLEGAREYTRQQRRTWRGLATATHLSTLAISATATIVLGFAVLDVWGSIGFALSAIVTTATAIEPFYNWRSRWVLAEEALAEWYRIEERLTMFVAATPESELTKAHILEFDAQFDKTWSTFNKQWLRSRRNN
jgi:hypothetical protein